jgi:hypothetical protein
VWVLSTAMALSPMLTAETARKTMKSSIPKMKSLPWYVTAAAMHRMMLKPPNKFYLRDQLSLNLAKATEQLRALGMRLIPELELSMTCVV